MYRIPVIAIFDIGKTNKKFFLLDESYKILSEISQQFPEIKDEDGDVCEDIHALGQWVVQSLSAALKQDEYSIKAINFSTYGASFVFIDEKGNIQAPLYNYLKPYPEALKKQFYDTYGAQETIACETASPVLESLNSGMQVYRLKHTNEQAYLNTKFALHLPQYISYLVTKQPFTDITSIGCHTQLWDFEKNDYHRWVKAEGLDKKMAPLFSSGETVDAVFDEHTLISGIGLHDSSAALIPYLANFSEPFILISTGTWCISLNPFNAAPLTIEELKKDCLCYMEYHGKPVKAARLFAGYEHEKQAKRLADHFDKPEEHFTQVAFDVSLLERPSFAAGPSHVQAGTHVSAFAERELSSFPSYEAAYHQFIYDIICQQYASTSLIMDENTTRIFVDGGFSKNQVYMNLLALAFPGKEVFAASVSQATAIGAALAIHKHWNTKPVPGDMIALKFYNPPGNISL